MGNSIVSLRRRGARSPLAGAAVLPVLALVASLPSLAPFAVCAAPAKETKRAAAVEKSAAEAPSWSFVVHAADLTRGLLSIDLSLRGFSGPLSLCADMRGATKSIRGLHAVPSNAPLPADADDADCFDGDAPEQGPFAVHYQLDLADLAGHHGDPDWATKVGDDYVFNEEAVLLRPDPLPDDAAIDITFDLPAGISVVAPWKSLDKNGTHFHSDARQYDAGSYVALGHLRSLGQVASHGGAFDLVMLSGAHRASDVAVRGWVSKAAIAVGDFYRGVPSGRALVILVPVPGESAPGVFGSTMHRAAPSAVLFFGGDAEDAAFDDDWMATHELFHIGNPRLSTRVGWFTEGSATYYQDVLRARASMQPAVKIWSDLYDGFRRYCDPDSGPLGDESAHLGQHHHYVNVYWGGACLFFRADVAIREHSGGKQSMDDLLRALWVRSQKEALDEDDLVFAIDRAAGSPIARAQLAATSAIPLDALYRKLGIVPIASDQVRLDERAPEASIRRAIFGQPAVDAPPVDAGAPVPVDAPATSARPRSSETQH